ncbi:SRPBCC family protein [Nitrosovibrio tenuis]|uniref:SRPBCC family protein n=1 Tax=Nitrosovibrio tenuis TaxID=1233 RepID=UPI0015A665A7|nr:SRPBCC family protein [Nitrosovibrio tenuis]
MINIIRVISAAFLLGLLLNAPVSAEAERQPKIEKTSAVNLVEQNNEHHDREIEVSVQNNGERIVIYVTFLAPVVAQQAWSVLTDFDNFSNFLSGVQSSKVINGTGDTLKVSQRGIIKYGFFTYTIDSLGEVTLSPIKRIHERMITGNMRKMEETTLVLPEGNQTRINYYADIVPGHWMLRFVGQPFIENDARERFQQMKNEMIRRGKMLAGPAKIS